METRGQAEPRSVIAGRYRLDAVLGSGAMATVYRAWDEQLDRAVAVKLYAPAADRMAELRFRDEAHTLATLTHPRLVAVHDAGTELDQMYLVLQLITGQSLRERLDNGALPPERVRMLGAELADALAYVHDQGVVHRDVKPANILLDGQSRPYLADFGISRLAGSAKVTAADQLVGTPAYLAPEQVQGCDAGAGVDVYALGLVLLECLTGRVEYPGPQIEAAVARLHRAPALPDTLPADLANVISAMTERDPARRPGAARCAELLRRGELGPSVRTAAMAAPLTVARRNAVRVLAAAGVAVIGAVGWGAVSAAEPFGAISGVPAAVAPAGAAVATTIHSPSYGRSRQPAATGMTPGLTTQPPAAEPQPDDPAKPGRDKGDKRGGRGKG